MGRSPIEIFKKMALYYDLNVFKDVYKLILVVFEITKLLFTASNENIKAIQQRRKILALKIHQ